MKKILIILGLIGILLCGDLIQINSKKNYLASQCQIISSILMDDGYGEKLISFINGKEYHFTYYGNPHQIGEIFDYQLSLDLNLLFSKNRKLTVKRSVIIGLRF